MYRSRRTHSGIFFAIGLLGMLGAATGAHAAFSFWKLSELFFYAGWIGNTPTIDSFALSNHHYGAASAEGGFKGPHGVAVDAVNGYFYVAEEDNHRVSKMNLSTGAFVGWIGAINTTGGTCTAGAGLFTGGWCSGGTSKGDNGVNGGFYIPTGLAVDTTNGYLYVTEWMGRHDL
jgi:DNA-binding beta-propeller fold protein YncE